MRKLLYTTRNDLSVPYFADWQVEYYDAISGQIPADLVYFRDPFNDPAYQVNPANIDQLMQSYQDCHIIDHLASFQDISDTEDKYLQSQRYQDLYPRTWLPSQQTFTPGQTLAKPRISQRAKDILFDLGNRKIDDSWIIQELLDIQEELRVYVICGQILPIASIKSSKSTGAVKIIGTRPLNDAEADFVRQIMAKCPLDVVGLDIAILPNSQYKLIEVNRSPQFKRYTERTDLNLAELIAKAYER